MQTLYCRPGDADDIDHDDADDDDVDPHVDDNQVDRGGPAAVEGTLRPGDRIIAVNGKGLGGVKLPELQVDHDQRYHSWS